MKKEGKMRFKKKDIQHTNKAKETSTLRSSLESPQMFKFEAKLIDFPQRIYKSSKIIFT